MNSVAKLTPAEQTAVERLTHALKRIPRRSRRGIETDGLARRKRRQKPYAGHLLPEAFPEALHAPVSQALQDRDGVAAMVLLLGDETGYFGRGWNRRNRASVDCCLPKMYEEPMITLARMIQSGVITTVTELQTRIEQVLAMTAWKYRTRSHRKWNPKLGHGRPKRRGGGPKLAPPLFVCGLPNRVEKEALGARSDEAAIGAELSALLDRARQALDPLELLIYEVVQEFRVRRGVSGAYPFAARRLVAIEQGLPGPFVDSEIDAGPTPSRATVARVRRIYLKVRAAFEQTVIQAGYAIPEPRRPSGKRTAPAGRLAAGRNSAG